MAIETVNDTVSYVDGGGTTREAELETVVVVGSDGKITDATGTREYTFSQAKRAAVGAASAATALGALGTSREVMLTASTDCYVAFGTSGVTVAASDADALRMFSGERFHLKLGSTVTHFAVIQDAASGYLRVTPVV